MIYDHIKNINRYIDIHLHFPKLIEFVNDFDKSKFQIGKMEIDGDNLFAIGAEYETRRAEEALWEAHKKYIDVHWILSGSERVGLSSTEESTITKPYDAEKDFFNCETIGQTIDLKEGYFLLLFPGEIHKTSIAIGATEKVEKIIFKVSDL
ncbi:MAG: YhcH/YjgK/YiaL family protein [Saprospiraceae bacterium]